MPNHAATNACENLLYDKLVPCRDVEAVTGLSKATIYRLMAAKSFPKPARVGSASRWSWIAVQNWIADQLRAEAAE